MKRKQIFTIVLFLSVLLGFSQNKTQPFKEGEWLKFRLSYSNFLKAGEAELHLSLSYSGFLKAGEAELHLSKKKLNGKEVLFANGKGRTSTVVGWFFKIRDKYQSYFDVETGKPYFFVRDINEGGYNDVETGKPYFFVRDINEGGYKKKKNITFNYEKKQIEVKDFLKKKDFTFPIDDVQDMISAFYFLRKYDTSKMKKGDEIDLKIFFDEEAFPFKLRFLGDDVVKTKFGKVKAQKFMPIVQSGRVFKEKESVTVWITSDANKIPIKISAKLLVGSLNAKLHDYKGLTNPFEIINK